VKLAGAKEEKSIMREHIKFTLIFITVFGLTVAPAVTFDKKVTATKKKDDPKKEEARTRALLVKVDKGEVDGLKIGIKKIENKTFVAVDPAIDFKAGDSIKVSFESNFDGYVYLVNVTPGGKSKVIYPFKQEGNNMVSSGQRYEYPSGDGSFDFDEEKGIEVVQVYMSRDRIKIFDDAVKNTGGELGQSASSAASELSSKTTPPAQQSDQGGVIADNTNSVLPTEGEEGVRTRKIRLAPGKDQEKVAIPENDKGAPAKMKNGEVALFEIRLKHI
jgi:hypothetical protein